MPKIESQPASATLAPPLDHLTRLVVTDEIRGFKARYLRLLDTQQWGELTTLFADDAHFTLASFGDPVVFHSTADWIEYVTRLLEGGTTVHQVHQGEIEVSDVDTASAHWAMTDYVEPAASSGRPSFHGHGHYTEQYRRIGGSWKIVDLELSRLMLGTGSI
jgi:hypothetical protein